MKKYIIPFMILLLLGACQSSVVFEDYEELPEEVWSRYNVVEFKAAIPDSGLYRVKLCLRHTTDFEMANLWCFISTRSHAVQQLKDTVNIKVAETDGQWLGTGGTIKTIEQEINRNPVNLPKGEVTFRIEQGMRMDEMAGVKNVGIKIEKVNEQR